MPRLRRGEVICTRRLHLASHGNVLSFLRCEFRRGIGILFSKLKGCRNRARSCGRGLASRVCRARRELAACGTARLGLNQRMSSVDLFTQPRPNENCMRAAAHEKEGAGQPEREGPDPGPRYASGWAAHPFEESSRVSISTTANAVRQEQRERDRTLCVD